MTVTPAQKKANAAWLKAHPHWTENRKKIAKEKATSTTVNTRPGIVNTLADAIAIKNALYNPAAEAAAAHAFALTQVPTEAALQASNAARETATTNVGSELLKSLQGIQLAGADQATGGLSLFTQGATDAQDAAAAAAIAAGGTVAPSTVTGAHDSLQTVAANRNNILAGQAAGAAKSINLYHQQNASELAKALDARNTDVTKIGAQEFEARQGRDSTELSNLLTYNLYNTQDVHKTAIARSTLGLEGKIAAQKAAAKVIDQGIAKQKNTIASLLANHKITDDQAKAAAKMYKAVEDVYNHQVGGTTTTPGTGGTTTHKVVVTQLVKTPSTTGGPLHDGKDKHSQQIYDMVPKQVVLPPISEDLWQQFVASGPQGQRKLALLGAQKGAKLVSHSTKTTGGTAGSTTANKAWTPQQSKQVLVYAGFTPPQVAAILKTLSSAGTPQGEAAAATLLAQIPKWLAAAGNWLTGG